METFSTLLALCAGNSSVTGEFPSQRPVTQSSYIFFELRLNKQLSKQLWVWWFEMPSRSLWRHCDEWMGNRAWIAMWQKSGLWNSLIFLELDREIWIWLISYPSWLLRSETKYCGNPANWQLPIKAAIIIHCVVSLGHQIYFLLHARPFCYLK